MLKNLFVTLLTLVDSKNMVVINEIIEQIKKVMIVTMKKSSGAAIENNDGKSFEDGRLTCLPRNPPP